MLPAGVDPRRPDKQQRYKPPPASNNAAPGEDLTPDYMNILDSQRKSMHSSHNRSDRFKVVKIESAEPFKRGRWECMDFLDQSYNRIFQHTSIARQVSSDVNINIHSASSFRSELHKALSLTNWGSGVDLHNSMLQLFYRQNNSSFLQSVSNVCQPFTQSFSHCEKEAYHNHVLMPGMVTSSLVGIKYPVEMNFVINETGNTSIPVPQRNTQPELIPAKYSFSFPFKGQILNQAYCCNEHSSNVFDNQFKRDVQSFQNMSSDKSHFVQQNDITNSTVTPNLNYSTTHQEVKEILNNNLQSNYNGGRAHNGSIADVNKQQTYQEQINACLVNNDNAAVSQRYLTEMCNTPNQKDFNNGDNRFSNVTPQIYGNISPALLQQATKYQEINNQTINATFMNNNQILLPNVPTQPCINGTNYKERGLSAVSASNSNLDQAPVHISMNTTPDQELPTKYLSSPLYSVKSEAQLPQNNCDISISPQLNNESNNTPPSKTHQYTSVNKMSNCNEILQSSNLTQVTNQTNHGQDNSINIKNQTHSASVVANPNYVQGQIRPPSFQNFHYLSNISNHSNGSGQNNMSPNENSYLTDSQLLISPYFSSSLVFPIISNPRNVPLCPQIPPHHATMLPNIPDQKLNDPTSNKTPQYTNTPSVQHVIAQNAAPQPQDVSSCVYSFLDEKNSCTTSQSETLNKTSAQNSIDTKIEALMDLVKKHLKYAVLEDVNVLKQKILVLKERVAQLEYENELMRRCDTSNCYKDNI